MNQQPSLFEQFLEAYEDDPVGFVRAAFEVEPYPDQIEMLEAYRDALIKKGVRRIAKRSGHGPGKTATLAWIIIHHSLTRFPQKTICTAPTKDQLFSALYSETLKWYNKMPEALQVFIPKADIFEHKVEKWRKQSVIEYRTSSAEKPEALAGVHEDNVLLVLDEGSAIADPVLESAQGSMSGPTAITIMTGNPTRRSGMFFDIFNKPTMMAIWRRLHTSSLNHPNVDPDFPKQIAAQYGELSNAYRVRVLGEFPLVDDDTIIPWVLLEAALTRDVKPSLVKPIWGVDVARKGRDASALAKRQGNSLMQPIQIKRGLDTMATTGWVKSEWDSTLPSHRPYEINVDLIGIGAGVADRLRELGLPVRGINVSESAATSDRFVNLRSELWWKGREWFEKKDCSLHGKGWKWDDSIKMWVLDDNAVWRDDFLAAELSWPTFDHTSAGKIQAEAKKVTMKRTGEESPNRADAFLLTLASDAITMAGTDKGPLSWNTPIKRVIKGVV